MVSFFNQQMAMWILVIQSLLINISNAQEASANNTMDGNITITAFKPDDAPITYPLGKVFCEGTEYTYVDFGKRSLVYGTEAVPSPVWILISGFDPAGKPQLIEGQKVVFDKLPGEMEYSDLKKVNYIIVPSNYSINSHTDAKYLLTNFTTLTDTSVKMFVNYPIVTHKSKVEKGMVAISKGWYKGMEVSYFDMGLNPSNTTNAYQPKDSFGRIDGNPVIATAPGNSTYSAFWKLTEIQLPNDIKNITSVDIAEKIRASNPNNHLGSSYLVVNRPLFPIDAAPVVPEEMSDEEKEKMKASAASFYHPHLLLTSFIILISLY